MQARFMAWDLLQSRYAAPMDPTKSSPEPRPPHPGTSARGSYLLASFVLVASMLVVLAYWQTAYKRQLDGARADFLSRTVHVRGLIDQRLDSNELVARSGASLVSTVGRPSRQQWRAYVDGLDMETRFPSLVALGYSVYLTPGQLTAMQQMLRDSGQGRFVIYPKGVREHYGPALYLEPRTQGNVSALGYDMYSEPVRKRAMALARDTGAPQFTAPIIFIQDLGKGRNLTSLILYEPVYRRGDLPESLAAKRESMQGWVLVAFRVNAFMESALRNSGPRPWLRITDVTGGDGKLLYEDPKPDGTATPAFSHSVTVVKFGRRWRLDFHSRSLAAMQADMTGLHMTLMVGLLASLLLFLIALVLARTRHRAEQLAGRMSESYRRSELRFRSAMQYSAIGKALLDDDDRIVEANPALAALLESTPDELVGQQFDSYLVGLSEALEKAPVTDGPKVQRISADLHREDGEVRHVELIYVPVPGEIGQDVVRLVQVQDITEMLRAQRQSLALNRTLEARVQARTRDLSRANDELETFAYSVSHDLRAPLRAIDGFSRLLAERYGESIDEAGREHIARVRGAAKRMGELIDSLLKMARLGRGGLKPERLDLSRMAEDVLSALGTDASGREVTVDIAPGLHATGDRGLVFNLMENLIGNAWKFTQGRADARIEVGQNDGGEFFVRDNGAGFAPEYGNKLFRPFQRLHSEEQFAGHGIGLASVKQIVERHGGVIRAEGKPGEGATFYFTLPDPHPE